MFSPEILGLVAGMFTTFSFVPQLIRVLKLKSAREISLLFNIILLVGLFLWLAYGILFRLLPVILWNGLSIAMVGTLLAIKIRYGRS